jgi:hypothetical protein
MQVGLNFLVGGNTGKTYISPSDAQVSGIEDADYSISGGFGCTFSSIPKSVIASQYVSWFANYLICAAPGPAYLGPCSSQP